jgi:hypothetical protein
LAVSYEICKNLADFVKGGERADLMKDYQLVKKNCVPWK